MLGKKVTPGGSAPTSEKLENGLALRNVVLGTKAPGLSSIYPESWNSGYVSVVSVKATERGLEHVLLLGVGSGRPFRTVQKKRIVWVCAGVVRGGVPLRSRPPSESC